MLYRQLSRLSANLAAPATLELLPHLLQFLSPGQLQPRVTVTPSIELALHLLVPTAFHLILFPQTLFPASVLFLKLLDQPTAEGLHALKLILQVLPMDLIGVAPLSELPYLHLVIFKIEPLPVGIARHDPQGLHLLRQSLDLNRLENHYEV